MNNNEHSPAAAVTDACDVFMNDRPRQVNELAHARVRVSCLGATGCYYDVTDVYAPPPSPRPDTRDIRSDFIE